MLDNTVDNSKKQAESLVAEQQRQKEALAFTKRLEQIESDVKAHNGLLPERPIGKPTREINLFFLRQ